MLLTSAAAFVHADTRYVRRFPLPGDPHGIAVGADGTVYVGLAQPQAVVAVDPLTGAVKRKVVLDSPEIASTKELVTLRTNAAATRLFIANGSDESASILALPGLNVLREITIEGEAIRDAVPDPKERFLYVLGRHVHVYDSSGEHELHTLPIEDPTAIAVSPSNIAVFDRTGYTIFDTANFRAGAHQALPEAVESAIVVNDIVFAAARNAMFEIHGPHVIRDAICLPDGSGPQITAPASPALLLFAERRCDSSALAAADRAITPASLYGVDAYAIAYDPAKNLLYTTERAGYLTIYAVPRIAVPH